MEDFILSNAERKLIFKALCEHKTLTFNRIADFTGLRSNKLSYQLNLMCEKNFLVHDADQYTLSLEAQRLIPYFSQIFKKEIGVLPVVLGIVRNGSKILLIQRRKMPYKGYWGLFGGKQINGESIQETIEREVCEESAVHATFQHVNGIVYERLRDQGQFKHSFLLIITTLTADSLDAKEQQEGCVAWFDFDDVCSGNIANLIPTDQYMIQKYHDKTMELEHVIMDERSDGTLTIMK